VPKSQLKAVHRAAIIIRPRPLVPEICFLKVIWKLWVADFAEQNRFRIPHLTSQSEFALRIASEVVREGSGMRCACRQKRPKPENWHPERMPDNRPAHQSTMVKALVGGENSTNQFPNKSQSQCPNPNWKPFIGPRSSSGHDLWCLRFVS